MLSIRLITLGIGLLFLISSALTGHLWPFGADGDVGFTVMTALFLGIAVISWTKSLTYANDMLTLNWLGSKKRLQVSKLIRVEHYAPPFRMGWQSIFHMEDETGAVLKTYDDFSPQDTARLCLTLQQSLKVSGVKKKFVLLYYLQGKRPTWPLPVSGKRP